MSNFNNKCNLQLGKDGWLLSIISVNSQLYKHDRPRLGFIALKVVDTCPLVSSQLLDSLLAHDKQAVTNTHRLINKCVLVASVYIHSLVFNLARLLR